MVPGGQDPRRRGRAGLRHRRAVGADHAVARRDGRASRRRWSGAASSFRCSSGARRRRSSTPRCGSRPSTRSRRCTSSTRRASSASSRTSWTASAARLDAENRARAGAAARAARGEGAEAAAPARARRATPDAHRVARGRSRRRRRSPGARVVDEPVAELRRYVDWTFFFHAWELKGRYPGDPRRSREGRGRARPLRRGERAARRDRRRRVAEPRGVYGFWPARAEATTSSSTAASRFPMLRQQADHADSRPNRSLADYVAPADGLQDRSVRSPSPSTAAERARRRVRGRERRLPLDHGRALADRLAEAFAERLHERARREWYAPAETLSGEELIARALPRHPSRFRLSGVPRSLGEGHAARAARGRPAGIGLTESFAMTPGSSVSGLYFGHPQARYFSVGRIGRDQVADYAARKGIDARRGRALAAPEPRLRALSERQAARRPGLSRAHTADAGHGREGRSRSGNRC